MTQQQFETRAQRAEQDLFVISESSDGWRVRSARNPARSYVVSDRDDVLACTCPDFATNAPEDPDWLCKHILAVTDYRAKLGATRTNGYDAAEREAIQSERASDVPPNGEPPAAQMLIKRSISPDGRIDSVSIEFAFALAEHTAGQIKSRALRTLQLQTEIVRDFLKQPSTPAASNGAGMPRGNGHAFGRLIDVGMTSDGQRFYLNVQVNGKRARYFGSAEQIAKAIRTAGERVFANQIEAGMRVNLPCRVATEASSDGRYVNVTDILPIGRRHGQGARP
jgi:hypothetical protein